MNGTTTKKTKKIRHGAIKLKSISRLRYRNLKALFITISPISGADLQKTGRSPCLRLRPENVRSVDLTQFLIHLQRERDGITVRLGEGSEFLDH